LPHGPEVGSPALEPQPSTLVERHQRAPPEPDTVSSELVSVPGEPGQDALHLLDGHGLGSRVEHGRGLPVRRETVEAPVAKGGAELLFRQRHIAARRRRRWRRLQRREVRGTQSGVPDHAVQFRRREVETQAAVWISIDGFTAMPRLLEGQHHVAAAGDGARVGQPLGDLLDGQRPAPLEEHHDHQVKEIDSAPAQDVRGARYARQSDPLAVAVPRRAHVAVFAAADHLVVPPASRPAWVRCSGRRFTERVPGAFADPLAAGYAPPAIRYDAEGRSFGFAVPDPLSRRHPCDHRKTMERSIGLRALRDSLTRLSGQGA
jgi:hypothetical protein